MTREPYFTVFALSYFKIKLSALVLPDDNDDAVEYVVWVPDVSKQAKGQQHEAHLQDEHAGENDVTDL